MQIHSLSWLAVPIFIISQFGFVNTGESKGSESKKPKEEIKQPIKKQANIDGFRSAKFGMKEKEVYRAIAKDFKISKSKVTQGSNAMEKTRSLAIDIPKLLDIGGPAKIVYIFGYKSKKLGVVNVVWGSDGSEKGGMQGVIDAANFLRTHLLKKKYEEGIIANFKLNEETTIVFRGKDKKNRMAILTLINKSKKAKKNKGEKSVTNEIILKLSYILHPDNPDILKIKDDDF